MTDDPLLGRQLANFRIERVIGRGGMAQVYYGQDIKLERPVAIKIIDVRYRGNPAYAERFVREARAVATWRHEHIIHIYYADDEDGLYYFVMEYIDGQDLSELISEYRTKGELIPHHEALRIGRAVAEALDYAHQQGLIHRDVKPSNVIVAHDGRVVLTDFGLALDVEQGSLGEVFGSSHYVAPEQARRSAAAVPQSDLYSLSVILYEMLTGRVPFDDPSPTAVAIQHVTLPPPLAREINPALNAETEAVLQKALSKSPDERYQTGRELVDALEKALPVGPSIPAPLTPQEEGIAAPLTPPGGGIAEGTTDDLTGQQLDEYRLEALLGQGGMARVYRGLDVRLNRRAAIKVIHTPFRTDSDYVRRFEREARAIAQLEHPHIVRLYRYGEANGLLYMAMQYIKGQNLHSLLASHQQEHTFIPPEKIGRIIQEVCLALDYAHSQGVIHRDIKPSNIMLDQHGQAILTDFGLALLTEVGTRGEILGSPHYIAPEQAISSANVKPQSDLYAVGVILYEMLTGQLPFEATDPLDVAMLHMSEPPPSPQKLRPDISPELEAVLLKALAKEPEERYPTGAALAEALDQALKVTTLSPSFPPVSTHEAVAEEVADLPPIPAAVAPQPAELKPEPPSITSVIATTAPAPTRSKPAIARLASKRGLTYVTVGIILILLLFALFWLMRGRQEQETPATGITEPGIEMSRLPPTESLAGADLQPTEEIEEEPSPTTEATKTPVPASPTATPAPTSTPVPILTSTPTSRPTLTPTPTPTYRLAFTRWDGGKHTVWVADLDGNNQQPLLDFAASPAWSPDGSYIAFLGEAGIGDRLGFGGRGVWTMNAWGRNPTLLKEDGAARTVAWIPVGNLIAYDAARGGPDFRVYFVDRYGSDQPGAIPGEQPAWSPDGQRLVIRACRPNCGLWVVNRDDSAPRQLTWGSSDSLPAWSPDGQKIAFSRGGNNTDIFIIDAQGADEPQQLTDAPGHDLLSVWTPNSRQIVFRTARSGRWQIYIMQADGSEQALIIDSAQISDEWVLDRMSVMEPNLN